MKPVILGAGLAGISAALALAPLPVILVASHALGHDCSSRWAQGGIAASVGLDDSAELHSLDTLAVGSELNDPKVVREVMQDAAAIIQNFVTLGVAFARDQTGALELGLEAAHRHRRIVHAADATGLAIMQTLIRAVRATQSITVIENASAISLSIDEALNGVTLLHEGHSVFLETASVVLATGGAAGLWKDTTNPHSNWGSGLALAARAGATLGDLEFMQFHPTALDVGLDPMPLVSEALRGEGALLIDQDGKRFIDELQARDIVAGAIAQKIASGSRVFLDARSAVGDRFPTLFPTIYAACKSALIDPVATPIPVRPAAHYHMGGVVTDSHGRTDVQGLWACGEVANTGLHGANRLASNSLLEAAAFGQRVARDIAQTSHRLSFARASRPTEIALPKATEADLQIRSLMSSNVGVVRSRETLEQAAAIFSDLADTPGPDGDKALVALMITQSALRRQETRGAHVRSDFPYKQPKALRSHFTLADMEDFQ